MSTSKQTLSSRNGKIDFESMLGQQTIITSQSNLAQRGGFYCPTCDSLLKDSKSYTVHINGRKHQKKLEISMNIRRVQPDEIEAKLLALGSKSPIVYQITDTNNNDNKMKTFSTAIPKVLLSTQREIDDAFETWKDLPITSENDDDSGNDGDDNSDKVCKKQRLCDNDSHDDYNNSMIDDDITKNNNKKKNNDDIDDVSNFLPTQTTTTTSVHGITRVFVIDDDNNDDVDWSDDEDVEYLD